MHLQTLPMLVWNATIILKTRWSYQSPPQIYDTSTTLPSSWDTWHYLSALSSSLRSHVATASYPYPPWICNPAMALRFKQQSTTGYYGISKPQQMTWLSQVAFSTHILLYIYPGLKMPIPEGKLASHSHICTAMSPLQHHNNMQYVLCLLDVASHSHICMTMSSLQHYNNMSIMWHAHSSLTYQTQLQLYICTSIYNIHCLPKW